MTLIHTAIAGFVFEIGLLLSGLANPAKVALKKQKGPHLHAALRILAPRPGLEPGTCGLTVRRSTD